MPSSLKLAAEYGDDLTVLFVESQGHTAQESEAFAWNRKWMGTRAMWTTEAPFQVAGNTIPKFALLSNEGVVLAVGNPLAVHKAIVESIEAEIDRAKEPPEGSPKALKKAWKAFAKGDVGKAIEEAKKVQADGGEDGEAAAVALARFVAHVSGKLDRVEWMLGNAYPVEAESLLKDVAKLAKGVDEVKERLEALTARLESDELEPEFEAARAFAKIESLLQADGFDDKPMKLLERFVEHYPDAAVTGRARHLIELAGLE